MLALFRFISLSLIAFFLLEPLIRNEYREVQRPIVAIAVDNSESILNGSDSSFYKSEFQNAISDLAQELSEAYEVELFSFSDEVSRDFDLTYTGKVSDLSNLMDDLETRFYNRNLGAVIIASDGNYNRGINPVYHPVTLSAPFYNILLGDTGKINDLAIDEIINNSISFLGDDFPVEINISSLGLDQGEYSLHIINNGKQVFEESGIIESDNWFKTIRISLPADQTGVQRYKVIIKTKSEELIKQNNEGVFYINILDERLKIAIITSTPHPDVAVWNNSLSKNKNYEVDVFNVDKFNKNISDYSLFILYQVPSKINHTALIDQIKIAKIPFLVQVGLKTNVNLLNQVLNGDYTFIEEGDVIENFNVIINESFSLFTIDARIKENQNIFPPFSAPLLKVSSSQVYHKLMTKKIGQLDSELPIWMLSESSYPKTGIIIGEGLWRWSMSSYSLFENHEVFDEFLQQSVKYLIRKGGNNRFEIDIDKEYFEGNRIKMNARLRDPSMEQAIGADISFTLTNINDEKFEYAFVESGSNYFLDLGILEAGEYSFSAKASLSEEVFTKKGKFTIKKMMLEQKDTRANAALMYQWADLTGGGLYYPDEIDKIRDKILESNLSSISYQTEQFSDIIRLYGLLFIIVLFLSVEWFLRRYFGSY